MHWKYAGKPDIESKFGFVYIITNKKTGKATSKKPMTKDNAEKQKKAIAISEKEKKDMKKMKDKKRWTIKKNIVD